MPGSMEKSYLHVEGDDDKHAMIHLLIRHGIDYNLKPRPINYPDIEAAGSISQLLVGMETAINLSTGRMVGFVLDADIPLMDRWHEIVCQLRAVGIEPPVTPPIGGYTALSEKYQTTVGIWLMPDNQRDGAIEQFLETLIAENDSLIEHARLSTEAASQLGAIFPPKDSLKAIIRTWLAWQKEPGMPYGRAIAAKYFRHDSPVADAFVAWFKRLYEIN